MTNLRAHMKVHYHEKFEKTKRIKKVKEIHSSVVKKNVVECELREHKNMHE